LDTTVVIPTFDRRDVLLATLDALAKAEAPQGQWEAIIVDDGSTDGTEAAARSWMASHDLPIRYVRQANRGAAAARNRGAAEGTGRNLIFLDNDILVARETLRRQLTMLDANPRSWVVGHIVHPPELRLTPFGRFRDQRSEEWQPSATGGIVETDGLSAQLVAMPSADFRRLGGFDEGYAIASCEDAELAMRARKIGIRVLCDPGNVVVHNDWATTLRLYCERQRLYSISDVRLYRKYGAESPRRRVVLENGPIDREHDSWRLMAKKMLKLALSGALMREGVLATCRLVEWLWPDSRLSHQAYDAAVGIAIFRGVREGFVRYPA
jgi:GT2 family glycosyltransferase